MYCGTLDCGIKFVLAPLSQPESQRGLVTVATVYSVGSYDELGIQEGGK